MKKKLISILLAAVTVLLLIPVITVKEEATVATDLAYDSNMTTAYTNYYYGGLSQNNYTNFKDIYENRLFFLCSQPIYSSEECAYSFRTAYFSFNNTNEAESYVYSSSCSMNSLLYDLYSGGYKTTKKIYAFSKSARAENTWLPGSNVSYPAAEEYSLYQILFEHKEGAEDNVGYLYLYQKPDPDLDETEGSDYEKTYKDMYIDYDTDKKKIYSRNDEKTEFTVNVISCENGIYKMTILLNTYSQKNNVKAFLVMGKNGLEVQCTKTDGDDLYIYLGCMDFLIDSSESQAYTLVEDGSKKTLVKYDKNEDLDKYKDTSVEDSFVDWISSASMESAYTFENKNSVLEDKAYYWRGESNSATNYIQTQYDSDPPTAHQALSVIGIHEYSLNYEYTVEDNAFGLEGVTTGNLFDQMYDGEYASFKSGDKVDQYNWVALYFESAKICGYNAKIDEVKFYNSSGEEVTISYTLKNDDRTLLINSMPGYDLTVKIKAHGEPAELDVNTGQYKCYVYDLEMVDAYDPVTNSFTTGYLTNYTTAMHNDVVLTLSSDPEIASSMIAFSPGRWIYNSSKDLTYYSFKADWYCVDQYGWERYIGTSYNLENFTWSNHFYAADESNVQVYAEITKSVKNNPSTYVTYKTDKISVNFTYTSDPEIKLLDVDTTSRRLSDFVIVDSNVTSGSWARENIAEVYFGTLGGAGLSLVRKDPLTGDIKSDNFIAGEEPAIYSGMNNFFLFFDGNGSYVIKVVNKNGDAKYAYLTYGNLFGGGENDDNWFEFKDVNTTTTKASDLVVMYFKDDKCVSGLGDVYIYDTQTEEKYPGTLHVNDEVGTKSDDSETVYTGTYYTFNVTKAGRKLVCFGDAAGKFEYVVYTVGGSTYYGRSVTSYVATYDNIAKPTSLTVTPPTKQLYDLNEKAKFSDMQVTAVFASGETLVVKEGYECSELDSSTPGTKTITVTYEGVSATFNVEVKQLLKLTKPSTVTKTYDGTELSGKVGLNYSEGTTVTYYTKKNKSDEYGSGSTTVPTITDVGTLYVKAVAQNPNYSQNSIEYTLTVNKKQLTVSGTTVSEKTYDGTANAAVFVGTVEGIANSGEVTVTATGKFADKNTGEEKDVTVTYELSGSKKENYTAPKQETLKATISTKQLGTSALNAADKVYDGTTCCDVTVTSADIVDTDDVKLTATGTFSDKNAGNDKNVSVTFELTGDDAANYAKPADCTVNASISKKAVSVKIDNKTTAAGAELAEFTYLNDPLCEGDSFTGSLETNANKDTAGIYTISVGTLSAGDNYTLTVTDGVYTVTDKTVQEIVFDTTSVTKTYGDAKFTKTVTGNNTAVSYSISDNSVAEVDDTTGEVTIKKAGTAYITAAAAADETYAEASVTYLLVVNKKKVDVPQARTGLKYEGYDQTGVESNDSLYTVSGNTAEDAGDYVATLSLKDKESCEWNVGTGTAEDQKVNWSIAKRNVTMTSDTKSKEYDGTPLDGSGIKVDGFAESEGANYKFTASITEVGSVTNAFTYELLGETKESNYNITKVEGKLIINKIAVDLPGVNKGLIYDGTEKTGINIPDNANYTVTNYIRTEAGTYNAVAALTDTTHYMWNLDEPTSSDQKISWTIGKAAGLTISGTDYSDVYDGNSHGEKATVSIETGTSIQYSVNGGSYTSCIPKIKDAGTMNVTARATNNNYETAECTYTLTVSPVTLSISGTTVNSKKYDGTYISKVTPGTLSGVLTVSEVKDDVSVDSDKSYATLDSKDVGNGINATIHYVLTGSDAGNYTVNDQQSSGSVTKRDVTLTASSVSRTYNGKALTSSEITESGDGFAVVDGKSEKPSSATMTNASTITDVGTVANTIGTLTDDTTTGFKTSNYNVTLVAGTLEVTKRDVTLTASSASKKYDGEALTSGDYTVSGGSFAEVGGKSEEPVNIKMTKSSTLTDVGTGVNEISELTDDAATGFKKSNYNVTLVAGTLEVTKRDVTLTASSVSKKYDGKALTSDEYTVSGDGFAVVGGKSEEPTNVKMTKKSSITDVGTEVNEISELTDDAATGFKTSNYNVTLVAGTLEVTKRDVTLTASSASKKYDGEALTSDEYTVSGDGFAVVGGKSEEPTNVKMTKKSSITDAGTEVNEISELTDCVLTGFKTANYNITLEPGTLEVTKRDVILTSATATKIYDGSVLTEDTVETTGDGFIKGEGVNCKVNGSQVNPGSSENTFTYSFENGTKADNYNIMSVYGKLTVLDIDNKKSNVEAEGDNLAKSFTKGETQDIVVDISDENNDPIEKCSAVLTDKKGKVVTNCVCEKGSIKVTVPDTFIRTLGVGKHEYILKITNAADMTYTCDLTISIEEPVLEPEHDVDTGDDSRVFMWSMLAMASVTGVAAVISIRRKKEEQ